MTTIRTRHAVYPIAFASAPPAAAPGYMATTTEAVQAAKIGSAKVENDVMLKRSPDSAAMLDYWELTDNIVDGIGALRLAGERYMPKFVDEEQPDYDFRLKCTKLTNVYRDTIEGLAAKPFQKEVEIVEGDVDGKKIVVPDAIKEFAENVDGSGNNLTIFAGATFFNGINSAIDWIFVDHPPVDRTIVTKADEKAASIRPYWSRVLGRNVLEPRSMMIGGKEVITYVRLYEPGRPDHIRVFERGKDGIVRWELFEKTDKWRDLNGGQTQFFPVDGDGGAGVVTIGVIPLVPFITGRRDGRTFKLFPAMRDAADLQIEVYQEESALKWNKKLGAYSMLTGNGVKPQMVEGTNRPKKIATGPGRVLYAPPSGDGKHGEWTYIQPSAEVMKFLADDVKETINQLRELARQPLTAQSGNVTVINSAVAAGKAKSAVAAWALVLKDALENAMRISALWMGISGYDPKVFVYTEFDEFLDGKDLESLDADRDRGDISQETVWEEKKRRGVYGPEFTPERERQRLDDEEQALLAKMPNTNGAADGTDDGDVIIPAPAPGQPKRNLPIKKPTTGAPAA
jgi:hypothetical protein